jgi:predicted anti-sigma-YlaC factor YlaD
VRAVTEHVEELLSEYMDDELTEMEKRTIEKHLAICSDCHNRLLELMLIRKELLAAYMPIEIPNIEENVIEKIKLSSVKRSSGVMNLLAFMMLLIFWVMLFAAASPFMTVGFSIFHSVYSIARGLTYAIPSIISAIPYAAEVIIALILCFIAIAILTLRYLVSAMGKTIRVEDL